ncbi:hypothetical protein DSECCO2_555860 [anaerobic digester metagenome]
MQKPVFFVSSTIYDFKDLRSGIKWLLEENNYSVNASEFNDFDKPLDENSYEACLKAIDNSDYFILLIGDRIGGLFDKEFTITQMEYRYAYQRMLEGKLKIVNFIRQDTWIKFLDSRKKIKTLETDSSIEKSVIEKLFSEEEKIRFAFIDEVRRAEEMKVGKKPKANWLHRFETFADITSVLKNELGSKFDLTFKQSRFIILNDIVKNLRAICSKYKNEIYPIGFMSSKLWNDFILDIDNVKITLNNDQYINYAVFYVSCLQIKPFRTNRIESFYQAGFFLEYDKDKNDFASGNLNQLVLKLLSSYDRLNNMHKSMYDGTNNKLISLGKKADNSHLRVTSLEIFVALEFYDELQNCINFSLNLYKALQGRKHIIPKNIVHERRPKNMTPKEGEYVTDEDILNYLNKNDEN